MSTDKPIALVNFNHRLEGGEVAWEVPGTGPRNKNYGDMLVCASVLRQVQLPGSVRVGFGAELEEPVAAGLVRGSTYLNRRFDFDKAVRTLASVDAPLAVVGLGAQDADQDPTFLDDVPAARRFVEMLDERSASISVRGDFTAAVVERLGATNIRVTGCPSMFYSLGTPEVAVPARLGGEERRLGVSLHTGLRAGVFCRNRPAALRKHGRVINFAFAQAAGVSLFEQGVELEYAVGNADLPMADRLQAAEAVLARLPNPGSLQPVDLVHHVVSVRSVEDWLAKARELDAMIGFRFHGNMVALTQGLPCFYYVYDSRLAEFCRLYRLPYLDVEDGWRDPVTAILEHDWAATTRAIRQCFQELRAFYEENGISHTFRDAA
jgi:hypothetical protein